MLSSVACIVGVNRALHVLIQHCMSCVEVRSVAVFVAVQMHRADVDAVINTTALVFNSLRFP